MSNTTFPWVNFYETLPKSLYTYVDPTAVEDPTLLLLNEDLYKSLNLNVSIDALKNILSGNQLSNDDKPLAQAYGGHQFGHFNILGDGRAILLGQIIENNKLWNIQLKGPGPTPYSRRGDGRGTLSSMLREYLISQAMFAFKIPTTRSLAVIDSGEIVRRQTFEPGGILTRLSESFVRVGTFQYAATQNIETVKALADYMIKHHFSNLINSPNPYEALFEEIITRQASLIALWQSIGFIHGVMNTDNMSIVGETIDYGPCAFMDTFHPKTVFSAIDTNGRYAYNNQANMALWDLSRLAETLVALFTGDEEMQIARANELLSQFKPKYNKAYYNKMSHKLALKHTAHLDQQLLNKLLDIMYKEKLDYTQTFSILSDDLSQLPEHLIEWSKSWLERVNEDWTIEEAQKSMKEHNPWIIPRNHLVENALNEAVQGHMSFYNKFSEALLSPYDYTKKDDAFTSPPRPHEKVLKTYCNT